MSVYVGKWTRPPLEKTPGHNPIGKTLGHNPRDLREIHQKGLLEKYTRRDPLRNNPEGTA